MTLAYSCYLGIVTLVVVVLPWAGLAAVIAGAALAAAVEPYRWGLIVAAAGALALVLGVLLRQRDAMATIRAGAWPTVGCGDRRPRTHDEFLDAVAALGGGGRRFDVVGGGWTSWMNRLGAAQPRLFTDGFRGFDRQQQLWRCGTTIYEMEAYYKRKGLAFPTFPTNGTIALGSWIACENHGNSGDCTGPSHAPFDQVVVLRRADQTWFVFEQQGTGVVRRDPQREERVAKVGHPNPTARKWLQDHPGEYLIMYAGINESKLIPIADESTWLQYRMIEVRTPDDVSEWLTPGAALRWLFVGSGRKYGLGVRMEPLAGRKRPTHRPFPWCVERPHREPHCCSVSCRYFQTDPCSYVCGWHEPPGAWNGYSDRLHANDWYPNLWWPAVTLGGVLLGIYNFEIIFLPPEGPLSGNWLHGVLQDLIDFFQRHRGRCELRSSNSSATSWVFLDCGIAARWFGSQVFDAPYRILWEHGVRVVANHTGKFYPPDKYLEGPGWCVQRVPAHALVVAASGFV